MLGVLPPRYLKCVLVSNKTLRSTLETSPRCHPSLTYMKNTWIIANWKSNKTVKEALEWVSVVGPKLPKKEGLKVVVCPPFTDVEEVKKAVMVGNYPLHVGVQDLSPFEVGPYTGEESASILKDFVDFAIIGHSERRRNFFETDEMVEEKVEMARKSNIIPLVCIEGVDIPVPEGVKLVAYEPVAAIGTGQADTPENAAKVATQVKQKYGEDVEVLYGGSVTSQNAKSFLDNQSLSGLLIGKASLDPEEFLKIVEAYGGD